MRARGSGTYVVRMILPEMTFFDGKKTFRCNHGISRPVTESGDCRAVDRTQTYRFGEALDLTMPSLCYDLT